MIHPNGLEDQAASSDPEPGGSLLSYNLSAVPVSVGRLIIKNNCFGSKV